ncbi:MFS transporter [Polyangium sp. 15x6]|uniref:MFS transporter n=1 Tax=Polyangium sp. 15x6 TaxID=3042687 RepID=UPI00249A5F88|nr:MFS transporter [Polyangium sp. 15x6]MDI3288616.1 MFS transporter [Polyangium sp. 15x6]
MAAPPEARADRSLSADLRALVASPRELWTVYAMKLLESVAYFAIWSLLVIFLSDDHGFSDTAAGSVAGTWLTVISLVVFLAGFIADGLGVRRALLIAALSTAIGRGMLAFAGDKMTIYAALAASVWGIACMKPTMNAAVRSYTTPATVSFAFSFYYVLMNVGSLAQGPLITEFRKWFKSGATIAGITFSSSQLVFLVGFVASCLNVVLALSMREAKPAATSDKPTKNPLSIARDVLREPAFWIFLGFVALLTFVRLVLQHAHLTWPKYALREFGQDFPFAYYWSINPAMIIVLTPLATALTRKYPPYPVISIGATITAFSVLAMAVSTTVTASIVFIVLLSIGEALWSPRLYEYTATIAPPGREASYMGLSEIPLFLAKPFVGFLSGYLLSVYCPPTGPRDSRQMWLVIGLMTIAAPVCMLVFRRKIERHAPDEAAPKLEAA